MKIAIVTDAIFPWTIGGSEIRNYEIAKRLVGEGHEVHIIGAKLWNGPNVLNLEGIFIHGVYLAPSLYNREGKRGVLDYFFLSSRIYKELINLDVQIIDCAAFNSFNCFICKYASFIKKTKLVLTWHQVFGKYYFSYFGKVKGYLAMNLERLTMHLTKNNLAVSQRVKKDLLQRNILNKAVKVIYNGVDISSSKKVSANKVYDLIFVGRLNYQKNISLLINAVKLIKPAFPKLRVCIVGDGGEKRSLLDLVVKYGLQDNFEFVGEIKDRQRVFQYMRSAKLFVLPSFLEGFPLVILEANSCGLPAVVTKTEHNDLGEYIVDGKNGFIVKPLPAEMGKKILNLIKNPRLIRKLSVNSQKTVKNFSWELIARNQEKYYRSLLN